MISLNLIYNAGFSWHFKGECHVKGFVHTQDKRYLNGETLLDYFQDCQDFREFRSRVAEANGMFSVVVIREGKAWLAVDRIRTFPLFYTYPETSFSGMPRATEEQHSPSGAGYGPGIFVSDSVNQIIDSLGGWTMNQDASTEFQATGYVTGKETLAEGIFQVQAAELIEFKAQDTPGDKGGQLRMELYSSYRSAETHDGSIRELEEVMDGITSRVFKRLLDSLKGRTAVVALSGGYDSRLIAAMLKKLEFPDVICFSYGRRGNPDML